jgi:hypothetical protein
MGAMARADAREKLVAFLESKAFHPVVAADAVHYPADKRDDLLDVQEATLKEMDRFRGYGSAEEVVVNFRRDLNSEPARKVHRTLKSLGLPTVNDVREEFEKLAADLDVK